MRRLNASARSAETAAPAGADERRIPVVVLTGFLGAGKTTVLNHLLADPGQAGTVVLVNELGTVGLDHHLVERVDAETVVLASGCICCSLRSDLVRALWQLSRRVQAREIGPVSRVVIETTGVADPAPVLNTLQREPFLAARFRCDAVVTVADVTLVEQQLQRNAEVLRQIVLADRLLLSKCDLAAPALRARVARRLGALNPGAELFSVHAGHAPMHVLNGCGPPRGPDADAALARWLAAPPAPGAHVFARSRQERHPSLHTFVLGFDDPVDWLGFSEALQALLQAHGERVLRMKALLNIKKDPLPRVVQCVQHVMYPPASLPAWPATPPFDERRSRLVFIVRDLSPEVVGDVLAAHLSERPRPVMH